MAEKDSLKSSWEDLSNDVAGQEQLDKKVHLECSSVRNRPATPRKPLSSIECSQLFDEDGRLVKEMKLRKALFEGGVDGLWRRYIWKFLFEIYPFNSTYREQKTIDLENRARYKALHQRWVVLDKAVHLPDEEPSSDPLEYVFSSDGEDLDDSDKHDNNNSSFQDNSQKSKIFSFAERVSRIDLTNHGGTNTEETNLSTNQPEHRASDFMSTETCPYCCHQARSRSYSSSFVLTDEESRSLLAILELPSKVYATRQPVDLDRSYPKGKRLILRDVKRTDRVVHYFSHKRNLRKVHRILHIYALFHPEIGYAQGMNDILARFLVVTDSEVDSYWMFCSYMEKKKVDFLEDTMLCKITLVKSLMAEIDEELYRFFEISECSDYLFCHRWLLLDFKREFIFMDSLRILEVLTSNHLELSSDRAAIEQEKVAAEEFAADGGESRAIHVRMNTSFTFDIFICIAILKLHKRQVSKEMDAASVYGYLNSLCMKMKVNDILAEAEKLLLTYCRQSVLKGFKEIDI